MWQEYAVQPECLVQSREAFRVLFNGFGWEHGRLLAKYPSKDWFRIVYEALDRAALPPLARLWIVEKLKEEQEARQRTVSVRVDHDPKLDWLVNAEAHQETAAKGRPFHAVVALANPRERDDVLVGEDLTDQTPLWRCEGTGAIPRTPGAIANSVAPLLARAERVLLIDPHFGSLEERFLSVLEAMLDRVPFAERMRLQKKIRLEYHLDDGSLVLDEAEFVRRTKQRVKAMLRSGASVDFFLWRQRVGGEKLHDRFVLSELGGVMFSVGLDAGEAGETTGVTRLGPTLRDKTWANFQEATAAFDLVLKFSVEG